MNTNGSACKTTVTRPRTAKRVVLAGRFNLDGRVADRFRKLGWEVLTVTADHDVHAAAAEADPHAILLLEEAGDESGYLAGYKMRQTQPALKVVVVGAAWTPERERFAEFVGATFATEHDVDELVNAVV